MKPIRPLVAAISASLLVSPLLHAADPKAPAPAPAPEPAPAPAAPALPAVVAVVEGTEIKGEDLDRALSNFLASQRIPEGALPASEKARGYRMILEEMIKEKLIEKRASGIQIGDDEVTATFKKFTAQLGPEEEVKKQIEASGQKIETIRENIKSSLQQEKWLSGEIDKAGGVSDQEAEDFYKKNTDKFVTPPEVRASHILVKVDQDAKPEIVTDKEKAAQAIADRVRKGEDFAKLAKELSEDPSAKQNSGDLDFFRKEAMVPEFSEKAFSMKKDEISDPVRSQFGYHIIKVTDRKEQQTLALADVKPRLLAFLKEQKAETLKQEIRLKADVKITLPEPPPEPAPAPAPAPKAP